MKKLILGSTLGVAVLASALNSEAQGLVTFSGASVTVSNTVTQTSAPTGRNTYEFGLYFGATAGTISTTPVLVVTNSSIAAGAINSTSWAVPGVGAGSTEFFVIKGWTIGTGSSYEVATTSGGASYAGVSPVGLVTLTASPSPAASLFGGSSVAGTTQNIPVNSLVLTPVPEPSTFVLGGAGLAALAFFRRRK